MGTLKDENSHYCCVSHNTALWRFWLWWTISRFRCIVGMRSITQNFDFDDSWQDCNFVKKSHKMYVQQCYILMLNNHNTTTPTAWIAYWRLLQQKFSSAVCRLGKRLYLIACVVNWAHNSWPYSKSCKQQPTSTSDLLATDQVVFIELI